MRGRALNKLASYQGTCLVFRGQQSVHVSHPTRTIPNFLENSILFRHGNNNNSMMMNNPVSLFGTGSSISSRLFSSSSVATGSEIMGSFGDKKFEGNNVEDAMSALANADAVCFDVDSTVIQEEGIDVLADYLGKGAKVAEFTAKAMGGTMKFEEALAERLKIIEPSRTSILDCLRDRPFQLSPGIERLVETLHMKGTDVYLVSGGFRLMIEPLAKEICVAKDHIYANTILFRDDDDGTYAGFDDTEPTSADGGKPKALQLIKEKKGYDVMVMVGDGATDAQAKPPAAAFIGFGGVAVREPVKEKACWFVRDFEDMIAVVEKFTPNRRNS